jgi:hypothetical protein
MFGEHRRKDGRYFSGMSGLLISALLGFAILLMTNPFLFSNATDITVNSSWCSGVGLSWDSTFSFCTITTSYAIASGDNLELISGTIPATSIHIGSGGDLIVSSAATLTIPAGVPGGIVDVLAGGTLTVEPGGTVNIYYDDGAGQALINNNLIFNYGTINVADSNSPPPTTACATGLLNNGPASVIYNFGVLNVENTGCTDGLFNSGAVYNSGTIDTALSTAVNGFFSVGYVLNECSGTIIGPIANGYHQAAPCSPTSLTTTLSSGSITAGQSVTDSATLGLGNTPTGSVVFFVGMTNICPNTHTSSVGTPASATGDGSYASGSMTFNTPGTYYWYAVYSGDSNNLASASTCEKLIVSPSATGVPEFPLSSLGSLLVVGLALSAVLIAFRKSRKSLL